MNSFFIDETPGLIKERKDKPHDAPLYPKTFNYRDMCPKKDICPGVTGDTKKAIYPIYCHYLLCLELLTAIEKQNKEFMELIDHE